MISEIKDNIFLGSLEDASDLEKLQEKGITHVLNASLFDNFYPQHFTYLSLHMDDQITTNLLDFKDISNDFISNVINNNGKVFVHCVVGASRSPTLIICYLVEKDDYCIQRAIEHVYSKRKSIRPNNGFLQQLSTLYGYFFLPYHDY